MEYVSCFLLYMLAPMVACLQEFTEFSLFPLKSEGVTLSALVEHKCSAFLSIQPEYPYFKDC